MRIMRYLYPVRVVYKEGEIVNEQGLFAKKPFQIGLMETNVMEMRGKASIILDFGKEVAGGARILTFKTNKNTPVRLRFGESVSETCAELAIAMADDVESGGYDILINCTGVGMHESVGTSPVTAKAFAGAEAAIDLIYNPPKSAFLQLAEAQGLQIVNGEAMLFYQAYYADCLYLGVAPNGAQARALYQQYKRENR